MLIRSNTKVNIGLKVLNKRSDGLHNLITIFQEINFGDSIQLKKNKSGCQIKSNVNWIPLDNSNLCFKAYNVLSEKLSKDLDIHIKPWDFNRGRNVLICCQRDGGWSMDGQGVVNWLVKTVGELRKYTDRPITVRFHPGDKNQLEHKRSIARYRLPNVRVSNADSIMHDLAESHCLVNHNSSPGVVAACLLYTSPSPRDS